MPVTITNCSNNYGPYQFPEKLIPLTILRLLKRENIPVYGKGAQIRDWLYVRDHAQAIWKVMSQAQVGETYNIGGHGEISNLEIVEKLCDRFDSRRGTSNSRDLITFVADRPGHDFRYAMDTTKVSKALGWHAEESMESGLDKTLDWYLDNLDWVNEVQTGNYQQWIHSQYDKPIHKR